VATYYLGVREFSIGQIRSPNSDTLAASAAVRVLNAEGGLHNDWPAEFIALGDHHKGDNVPLNLAFKGVDVPDPAANAPDGGAIYWSFVLVNKGNPDNAILQPALEGVANAIVAADTPSGDVMSEVVGGTLPGSQGLVDLFTSLCDGVVAAQAWSFTAAQLAQMTQPPVGAWTEAQPYPGLDSPTGCGANSQYSVVYTTQEPVMPPPTLLVTVPRVIGLPLATAEQDLVNYELQPRVASLYENERYDEAVIINQTPIAGSQVPKLTEVSLIVGVPEVPRKKGGGGGKNVP
jgi:hypothetical protein